MTIAVSRERIDYGGNEGSRLHGPARQVINAAGTARVLTKAESGALCIFGTAAGQAYTLPAIGAGDVGMEFEFVATVTGTGTYSVTTDAATTFMGGGVDSSSTTVAEGGDTFVADPAASTNFTADSDLTGRLVGTHITLTAISTTVWAIRGTIMGVGTLATPF
jgi:hypothetical protein